ncbi:unnamed protein product [Sphagnum balticum]
MEVTKCPVRPDTPSRTPWQTTIHRPSSGNGNLLLSRSHGSQALQADIIDKVEVDEGGFSVFSATKSEVGASDVSVEFAQHESNSSLSDIDLQYTATIHDPERSLHQEEPLHQAMHSNWLLWGKMGMRLEESK